MIDQIREDRIESIRWSGKSRQEAESIVDAPVPVWASAITIGAMVLIIFGLLAAIRYVFT